MRTGLLFAGSPVLGSAAQGKANTPMTHLDIAALKTEFGFKGAVLTRGDALFETVACGEIWNKLQPARRPQIIAQVRDEQDVVAAVKFARASKLKVAVRGGGHNWVSPSLRNGGMLIDLTSLDKLVSIDPVARKAVLQPIISNRELQAVLNKQELSFPGGHCPTVKLSGYLLSGGMSWNHGVWGPGVGSVEAIELVNANGDLITATATENPDYFWAARGSGPAFFGVVVRYHLKLYPLPRAITAVAYYYPYDCVMELASWLDGIAASLPSSVELSLFVVQAPGDLADTAVSHHGKVALVTATMFADSAETALSTLRALDSYPSVHRCLSKSGPGPTDFERLFDASGALWPANLRCKVDAMFFTAPLPELIHSVQDHLPDMPPKSVFLFAVYTGKDGAPATPPDAAFSMTGTAYGGPWTMWDDPQHDVENARWHERCVEMLEPHVAGHYVAESDTVGHPEFARRSYTQANWERLGALRAKHDPHGLFYDFDDGLD